ncbi:hypothetical protein LF1_11370 [Rubripirellula obstinata]|uniref:Uncharacterized protein n=1 Tax=Rubripirellula obstinata TaxID=406547 RepID=A0A5B1CFD2_9BACT|nr:hypothetical protein LF1_11370 [Rubripirellula obstinata]
MRGLPHKRASFRVRFRGRGLHAHLGLGKPLSVTTIRAPRRRPSSATPGGYSTIADGATANPPGVADTPYGRSSTRRRTPLHQRQSRRQPPDEVRLPPRHHSPLTVKQDANASLRVDRYRDDVHHADKKRGAYTPLKRHFTDATIGYADSV